MADFEQAYSQVAAHTAAYLNGEQGRNGETYCAISRRHHPDWSGWRRIDAARQRADFPASLDRDRYLPAMVERFYRHQYWDRLAGDKLPDQVLAEELYRTAVRVGIRRSVRNLQQSLKLLNPTRRDYTEMSVDGLLGDITLRLLRAQLKRERGSANVLQVMQLLQGSYGLGFLQDNPRQQP